MKCAIVGAVALISASGAMAQSAPPHIKLPPENAHIHQSAAHWHSVLREMADNHARRPSHARTGISDRLILAQNLNTVEAADVIVNTRKVVWSGRATAGANINTGNSDTTNVSLGLRLARETPLWKISSEGDFSFGTANGVETSNRFFVAGQVERQFSERLFGFVRGSFEQDDFSGFETRLFVGAGIGFDAVAREKTTWSLELAPGFRIDGEADVIDSATGTVIVPGSTLEDIGVRLASRFTHVLNDAVTLNNNSDATWSPESTQLTNISSVEAQLTRALALQASFEVRFDTNPPFGFEDTDTATRLSLVYGF